MEIKYCVKGKQRKALVMAITDITGEEGIYKGPPTYAYEFEWFTVDRYGTLLIDEIANGEVVEQLIKKLANMGFTGEQNGFSKEIEGLDEKSQKSEQCENVCLTVELPLDSVSINKLNALLDIKGDLIKKALGVDALLIEVGEESVSFPWFTQPIDVEHIKAYTHFISAICEMTKKQKRINSTENSIENEKYAFRCFLLRLGFIGREYKDERKILLQNLSGTSDFKCSKNREVVEYDVSE